MDKIILAHYINVGNVNPQKVAEILGDLSKSLAGHDDVLHYIYPITQGNTRVDCINPKLVTGEEYWKRPTFDIYLNRVKEYNPAGRSQKLEEAIEIDRITTRRVEEIKEFDLMVDGEKASTEKIMDAVLTKYNELAKY